MGLLRGIPGPSTFVTCMLLNGHDVPFLACRHFCESLALESTPSAVSRLALIPGVICRCFPTAVVLLNEAPSIIHMYHVHLLYSSCTDKTGKMSHGVHGKTVSYEEDIKFRNGRIFCRFNMWRDLINRYLFRTCHRQACNHQSRQKVLQYLLHRTHFHLFQIAYDIYCITGRAKNRIIPVQFIARMVHDSVFTMSVYPHCCSSTSVEIQGLIASQTLH